MWELVLDIQIRPCSALYNLLEIKNMRLRGKRVFFPGLVGLLFFSFLFKLCTCNETYHKVPFKKLAFVLGYNLPGSKFIRSV